MLYPFKFKPIYKEILWGGRNIEKYFKRNIPDGHIAESWELSCRDDGMSIIRNGELAGLDLWSLILKYKEQVLGTLVYEKYGLYFPILVKIIDANDRLSVQVHPDDNYAKSAGERNGKNEAWYIIDAKEDARLIYGLKGCITKEAFIDAYSNGKICESLNEVCVKPGDCLYIPAGTVHAILQGILIAEIQQNSNTTYRIYDWDRCDSHGNKRELHIDKALDVINFSSSTKIKRDFDIVYNGNSSIKKIVQSEFFNIDEITIADEYSKVMPDSTFISLLNIWGSGCIYWNGGEEKIDAGDTLLLPASLRNFKIKGKLRLLSTYIE